MKRDPDLIRRVMLAIEAIPAGQVVFGNQLGIDDVDDAVLAGHLLLLLDASFLEGQSHGGAFDGPSAETFVIVRLTSAGHDFLDAVRSDTVWKKTKDRVANVGGSVSLSTLTEVAGAVAKALLGL